MGALPKPELPSGPAAALADELHRLHHRAGLPSLREMAKEIGCSHTTVSAAFSEPRVPRWGLLELIVETLGGDVERFHELWLAASGGPVPADAPAAIGGAGVTAAGGSGGVPRQLPLDVAAFTGRAAELAELDALANTARIVVVTGTAGVGKTALAVRWAHRAADRFPDGQLYLNLRGYDPGDPMTAAEALEALLRGLGVEGAAIPHDAAERAARYRTLLAERRTLVLLDNAHSVEQVRDLLPGAGASFVLVTSRATLPALVARYGAARVSLDLLPPDEAVALLATLVGPRVDEHPGDASELAARCAQLPLALRIAAELAASRPGAALSDLIAELERLDALDAGDDEYTAVRSVFSWSHRHLSEGAALAFQLIGLHPGRELDDYALAALSGLDIGRASRLLGELTRANLAEAHPAGRYGMHDLLRAHAAELAAGLPADERACALDRLYDHYRYAAAAAMDAAFPHNAHQRPRFPEPSSPAPHFDGPAAARAWLAAELGNLLACAAQLPVLAGDLSATLAAYLDERALYDQALTLHALAKDAVPGGDARALNQLAVVRRRLGQYAAALDDHLRALAVLGPSGDPTEEARARHGVGVLHWRAGRCDEARDELRRAVALYRATGDRSGEGAALYGLGIASRRLGEYRDAETFHLRAIGVLRDIGDQAGEGRALNNLGVVRTFLRRYDQAAEDFARAADLHRAVDDLLGEGVVLDNLGSLDRRLGRYDDALGHYRAALRIYRDIGYRVGEGDALRGIGATLGSLGRAPDALSHLRMAVDIGRSLGAADVETGALIDLGDVHAFAGDTSSASASYTSALALLASGGDPYEKGRALDGLGRLAAVAGDPARARDHWRAALEVYAALGLPDEADVRERMEQVTASR